MFPDETSTERHNQHFQDMNRRIRLQRETNRDLQRRLDECQLKAARYDWLRSQHWDEADIFVVQGGKNVVRLGADCPSGERLDLFIDAAMKEQQ